MELTIPAGIKHTATGVIYTRELTLDQLIDHRRFCAKAHTSSTYWLLSNAMEIQKRYGDEALARAEAEVTLDLSVTKGLQALMGLRVPIADCLSMGHYMVLAKKVPEEAKQAKWIETAARENLSPAELKLSIAQDAVVRIEPKRGTGALNHGVATAHAVRTQFDFWFRQVKDIWETWDAEKLEAAIELLEPIEEFVSSLRTSLARLSAGKGAAK